MHRFSQTLLAILVGFASPAAIADEADSLAERRQTLPDVRLPAETMLAEVDFESRADLFYPAGGTMLANGRLRPIGDVDFADGGILSRFRKLRAVSLLTVAEVGDSRLFLGVNKDGIVGLHFGAYIRATRTRHLELLRMPYLAARDR